MNTQEIDQKIKEVLDSCDKTGLIFVCNKIQTEYGMDYCIGRVKSILLENRNLSLRNAISHLEAELIEQKLY